MHAPDKDVPVSETCAGINDAYKEGLFQRFGLSNYSAQEVQAVYDACQKEGWVLPTAYQGNYSPVARKQEEILFPTLRKLGMAFYAYSPMAVSSHQIWVDAPVLPALSASFAPAWHNRSDITPSRI